MYEIEIPESYECEECGEEMEELEEGEFHCSVCGSGISFYIEDGKLFGDVW
jgi:Zn finger protein HypA/HybF involved in hydrogenase expression